MEVPQPPKLLDRVRQAIRFRHLSCKTEKSYPDDIRDFILFHQKCHPRQMGVPEVRADGTGMRLTECRRQIIGLMVR